MTQESVYDNIYAIACRKHISKKGHIMTGARIILNAAEEVTGAPIGWRDDVSKHDLTRELAIQCHARTHESFGSRTSAVLEAVVAAACQIGPCWPPDDAINRFIFNQTDSVQKLTEVLGRVGLGQTWQIFTITEDERESFYLATDEIYQQAVEDMHEATVKIGAIRRMLTGIPMIGDLIGNFPAPRIRLLATAEPARRDTDNDAINDTDAEPADTDHSLVEPATPPDTD